MTNTKRRILSTVLAAITAVTLMFSFTANAFAASLPSTSITSVSAKNGGFKVNFKKASNITGYQVQYATDKSFTNKKSVKVKNASSKTVTGLTGDKKYYIRVRTYKTSNGKTTYSSWSKTKTVTTDFIGLSRAKTVALNKAGLSASSVTFTKAHFEYDDGYPVYEIEFRKGRWEYDCTVNAKTGKIMEYDVDYDD